MSHQATAADLNDDLFHVNHSMGQVKWLSEHAEEYIDHPSFNAENLAYLSEKLDNIHCDSLDQVCLMNS